MILKGSQRGGATNLALHLMNEADNDHITLHELDGFVSDELLGAFTEAEAIASCTKCPQFLFSLSINPPQHEYASVDDLEQAAKRAGKILGLSDQPHALVIHEKEGRRHAHAVWSRIDAAELKAINLPYFKNKLAGLSKELFLEHGWELPNGFKENGWKSPLNFTLAEWQQAKRLDLDPREIKQIFQSCWQRSDGLKAYAAALAEHGYFLAKGDRRGFIAVDIHGEIYSLSRWSGLKAKELKLKLGDPEQLPSVDTVQSDIKSRVTARMRGLFQQAKAQQREEMLPFIAKRGHLIHAHRVERQNLAEKQEARRCSETKSRNERLRKGLLGVWDALTGKAAAIKKQNEKEAYQGLRRDRRQQERLFIAQMKERKTLQGELRAIRDKYKDKRLSLNRFVVQLLSRSEAVKVRSPASHTRRGPGIENRPGI